MRLRIDVYRGITQLLRRTKSCKGCIIQVWCTRQFVVLFALEVATTCYIREELVRKRRFIYRANACKSALFQVAASSATALLAHCQHSHEETVAAQSLTVVCRRSETSFWGLGRTRSFLVRRVKRPDPEEYEEVFLCWSVITLPETETILLHKSEIKKLNFYQNALTGIEISDLPRVVLLVPSSTLTLKID